MRFSIFKSVITSSIIPFALAQTSLSTAAETCITKLGLKTASLVPTKSSTLYALISTRLTTTSTPSTIITPPPVTSTSIVIAISINAETEPVITDYYTSTSTEYQTTTLNFTASTTSVTTVTTSTQTQNTVTVPTPAGFVPVASGLGYPGTKKKRDDSPSRFNALERRAVAAPVIKAVGGKVIGTPTQYPTAVTCELIVNGYITSTIGVVAKRTTTITAAPSTSTAYTTTTVSTTTTIYPADAEITTLYMDEIAVTTSTTTTQTSTSTFTTTLTVSLPDATYYVACAPNNVVRTVNGATFDAL